VNALTTTQANRQSTHPIRRQVPTVRNTSITNLFLIPTTPRTGCGLAKFCSPTIVSCEQPVGSLTHRTTSTMRSMCDLRESFISRPAQKTASHHRVYDYKTIRTNVRYALTADNMSNIKYQTSSLRTDHSFPLVRVSMIPVHDATNYAIEPKFEEGTAWKY